VDYRHFRIDRIRRLEISPEKFEPREGFSFKEHMEQSSAREKTLPVRVWFHRTAQERAQRESYATLIEEKTRDGGAEFALYAWSLEWMARWLLSFGDRAEALEPPKLRALVRAEAAKIARLHAD
jgi:predicted DNA-binding transcriptional regulator YafY